MNTSTLPMAFDSCGHAPLTYAEPAGYRYVQRRLVRCVYAWCDHCVPSEVKRIADGGASTTAHDVRRLKDDRPKLPWCDDIGNSV